MPQNWSNGVDTITDWTTIRILRGCSSAGRAVPCQGTGRRFEPVHPLQAHERQHFSNAASFFGLNFRKSPYSKSYRCISPALIPHRSAAEVKNVSPIISFRVTFSHSLRGNVLLYKAMLFINKISDDRYQPPGGFRNSYSEGDAGYHGRPGTELPANKKPRAEAGQMKNTSASYGRSTCIRKP